VQDHRLGNAESVLEAGDAAVRRVDVPDVEKRDSEKREDNPVTEIHYITPPLTTDKGPVALNLVKPHPRTPSQKITTSVMLRLKISGWSNVSLLKRAI
jgi:hypothetical protein